MRQATYFHTLLISSSYTSGSCIRLPVYHCPPPLLSDPALLLSVVIKGLMAGGMQCLAGRLYGCSGGP